MTLAEAKHNIGRRVVYCPENPHIPREFGVISSVNDRYVFVRYDKSGHSAATAPEDLYIEHRIG